jgi:hypothetical protein
MPQQNRNIDFSPWLSEKHFLWRYSPNGAPGASFLGFLNYKQWHITVARTPLDEGLARRRDLYLTTHNTHKSQTTTSPVGFEHAIPASEQTLALDRSTTGIGTRTALTQRYWTIKWGTPIFFTAYDVRTSSIQFFHLSLYLWCYLEMRSVLLHSAYLFVSSHSRNKW